MLNVSQYFRAWNAHFANSLVVQYREPLAIRSFGHCVSVEA
jgi:hypothetical protein